MSFPDPLETTLEPRLETTFRDLHLPAELLRSLEEAGYEAPSPIQAQAIPHLLKGLDLLGHAPTGTGKTAAFALPLLARLDASSPDTQVVTLTPTRELAIQVAQAFKRYAAHVPGIEVLPIYGGNDIGGQLRRLKRGVHVVVGTPGRVMDHMRRGTLRLDGLQALVLDEADEMLRMGFVDDVEWILEKTPKRRQMALFSATMPPEIERIVQRHLRSPEEVSVRTATATAETIRQSYWLVGGLHKLDALSRILEVETHEGILIFVRTKRATEEIAAKLEARGYSAAAMNGDMAQKQREQMVARFKSGALDLLVATDVAARGLDVDRVSHVINYDIPYDTEAYIHRIGRTGRAGRRGDAILFVAPRERRMLNAIERATRQKIERLQLPSAQEVNDKRIHDFKQRVKDTLDAQPLELAEDIVAQFQSEHDVTPERLAAALAHMAIGDRPLLVDKPAGKKVLEKQDATRATKGRTAEKKAPTRPARASKSRRETEPEMETFRLEVGTKHGVEARNIMGAITGEAGLEPELVGRIDINEAFSTVELPTGMPRGIYKDLRKTWVCGQQLRISRVVGNGHAPPKKRIANKNTGKKRKPNHLGRKRPIGGDKSA